jgi:tetratricopeptide (TPR) repeat protein
MTVSPCVPAVSRAFLFIIFLLPGCGIFSFNRDGLTGYFQGLQLYQQAGMTAEKEKDENAPEVRELLAQALEKAENSRAVYPHFPPSHKLSIDLARMLGDEDRMLRSLEYALALFPDEPSLRLAYAQCLLKGGEDYPAAIQLIREGLKRDPRDISLRQSYAELLLDSGGSGEEIEKTVLGTLRIRGLPQEYYSRVGFFIHVLAEKGMLSSACRILVILALESPAGARHGFNMALSTGLGEAGLELLEYTLEKEGKPSPVIRVLHVRQLIFLERYDRAEAELQEESFAAAMEELGEPEALKALEAYLPLGRDDPEAAADYFFAVLEEYPGCFFALEGLILLQGRTPESVDDQRLYRALQKALRETENSLEIGMIHQSLNALSEREARKYRAR